MMKNLTKDEQKVTDAFWSKGQDRLSVMPDILERLVSLLAQERDRAVRENDGAWELRMAEKVSREVRKALDEVEKALWSMGCYEDVYKGDPEKVYTIKLQEFRKPQDKIQQLRERFK